MEVVVAGFGIVDVGAVAQGVQRAEGGGQRALRCGVIAPGVVPVVGYNNIAGIVIDANDIALTVEYVVVGRSVPCDGSWAKRTIGKVQGIVTYRHLGQLTAIVHIVISLRAVTSLCTHPVGIVGVRPGCRASGHGGQFSAVAPSVSPCAVGQQVADLVIGPGHAVIGSQQVAPGAVTVGVGIGCGGRAGNGVVLISKRIFLARITVEGRLIPPTVSSLGSKKVSPKIEYSQNLHKWRM